MPRSRYSRACWILWAIGGLAILPPQIAAAGRPGLTARQEKQINIIVPRLMASGHVPGLELGIARDGQAIFLRGYGQRDIAHGLAVDAATRFQIGSITKQFTAAAILQLRDQGKLALGDHVSRFLPRFPHAAAITIEELLNQTSGLFNFTDAPGFLKMGTSSQGGFAAVAKILRGRPLAFPPGTKWQYSNTNYMVLGRIVAIASGQPYPAYIDGHIFAPAAMRASGWIGRPMPDLALGYGFAQGRFQAVPSFGAGWTGAAGGIVINAADLIRWDRAVSDGALLPARDWREMTTAGRTADGRNDHYGFGWVIGSYGGDLVIWHNGGTAGFLALNAREPSRRLEIVVLENSDSLPPWTVAHAVLGVLQPASPAARAPRPGANPAITARVREAIGWAIRGHFDRAQLTPQMNAALTPAMVSAVAAHLQALGPLQALAYRGHHTAGDATVYIYRAKFENGALETVLTLNRAGKIAGFLLRPTP
ncbi:MAG: serine hydrolase [Terriglobales bacterium]